MTALFSHDPHSLPGNLLRPSVPLQTGKILRLVARIPHLTLKIVAGIH